MPVTLLEVVKICSSVGKLDGDGDGCGLLKLFSCGCPCSTTFGMTQARTIARITRYTTTEAIHSLLAFRTRVLADLMSPMAMDTLAYKKRNIMTESSSHLKRIKDVAANSGFLCKLSQCFNYILTPTWGRGGRQLKDSSKYCQVFVLWFKILSKLSFFIFSLTQFIISHAYCQFVIKNKDTDAN